MKVFVTGAAGFIGTVTVQELLDHGHQVIGLARSDASAEAIAKAGAEVVRGDLEDLESLKSGAKAADGVVHLGFVHDFSDFERVCRIDREAIQAMGDALAGTNKPLLIASGTMMVPKGELATEDTEPARGGPFDVRGKSEDLLFELSKEKQVRGIAIRLAPTVHGAGDKGFVTMIGEAAKKNGFVTRIAERSNRWPAVHRKDAAVLFRLALEKGKARSAYHAAAEIVLTREIMEAIGKKLQLLVESKSTEEAMGTIGFLAMMANQDNPVSSEKTRKELGWEPVQPELVADIEANYFN